MKPDFINIIPGSLNNYHWLTSYFGYSIREFDGWLKKDSFPMFIIHGDVASGAKDRQLCFSFLSELSSRGISFGIVHLYDENYDHDISCYYLSGCKIVFRNYFRPTGGVKHLIRDFSRSLTYPFIYVSHREGFEYLLAAVFNYFRTVYNGFRFMRRQYLPALPEEKVFFVPLGYIDKFDVEEAPNCTNEEKRKYKWSFCGDSHKSDRQLMLRSLRNCQPNFIHEYSGGFSEDSLSGERYRQILCESIFSPCPMGYVNIDTFRLFESLESGAIPIILKSSAFQPYDYYTELLSSHPIPTFSNWRDVANFLDTVTDQTISELNSNVRSWYTQFREQSQREIKLALMRLAEDSPLTENLDVGREWSYVVNSVELQRLASA